MKVVLGMLLAVLLTSSVIGRAFMRSAVFFPVLVSTIGVGLTFTVLMEPDAGLINKALAVVGIEGPRWLVDPKWALMSVALVDVWKGVGLATVIYIAGIVSVPREFYDAAKVDGATPVQAVPLHHAAARVARDGDGDHPVADRRPAVVRPDLGDDPRRARASRRDVIASVIYKQYQAGFYGLSTAGNVVLFILVTAIVLPLYSFLRRREVQL